MAHDPLTLIHGPTFLIPLLPLGCSLQTSVVPASPNSFLSPVAPSSPYRVTSSGAPGKVGTHHPHFCLLTTLPSSSLLLRTGNLTCMPMTLVALYLLLNPPVSHYPRPQMLPSCHPRHQCASWAVASGSQTYLITCLLGLSEGDSEPPEVPREDICL